MITTHNSETVSCSQKLILNPCTRFHSVLTNVYGYRRPAACPQIWSRLSAGRACTRNIIYSLVIAHTARAVIFSFFSCHAFYTTLVRLVHGRLCSYTRYTRPRRVRTYHFDRRRVRWSFRNVSAPLLKPNRSLYILLCSRRCARHTWWCRYRRRRRDGPRAW